MHGNWTAVNAKSKLLSFKKENKVHAGYVYTHSLSGRSCEAEMTLYIPQLERKIVGQGIGAGKKTASKQYALSIIHQLYYFGVITAFNGPRNEYQEDEVLRPFPMVANPYYGAQIVDAVGTWNPPYTDHQNIQPMSHVSDEGIHSHNEVVRFHDERAHDPQESVHLPDEILCLHNERARLHNERTRFPGLPYERVHLQDKRVHTSDGRTRLHNERTCLFGLHNERVRLQDERVRAPNKRAHLPNKTSCVPNEISPPLHEEDIGQVIRHYEPAACDKTPLHRQFHPNTGVQGLRTVQSDRKLIINLEGLHGLIKGSVQSQNSKRQRLIKLLRMKALELLNDENSRLYVETVSRKMQRSAPIAHIVLTQTNSMRMEQRSETVTTAEGSSELTDGTKGTVTLKPVERGTDGQSDPMKVFDDVQEETNVDNNSPMEVVESRVGNVAAHDGLAGHGKMDNIICVPDDKQIVQVNKTVEEVFIDLFTSLNPENKELWYDLLMKSADITWKKEYLNSRVLPEIMKISNGHRSRVPVPMDTSLHRVSLPQSHSACSQNKRHTTRVVPPQQILLVASSPEKVKAHTDTIYTCNLPERCTAEMLRDKCQSVGEVIFVAVTRCSIGIVQYEQIFIAKQAVSVLNQTKFNDKTISVGFFQNENIKL